MDKHNLGFPVGRSVGTRYIAAPTGAFVNADPLYLQSTGFVHDPAGRLIESVYEPDEVMNHAFRAAVSTRLRTRLWWQFHSAAGSATF